MKLFVFVTIFFIGVFCEPNPQKYCQCLQTTYTELFAEKGLESEIGICIETYPEVKGKIEEAFAPIKNQIQSNQEYLNKNNNCVGQTEMPCRIDQIIKMLDKFSKNVEQISPEASTECLQGIVYQAKEFLTAPLKKCNQFETLTKLRCTFLYFGN